MDKCPKCGEILTLTEQSSKIAELEKDAARYRFIQLEDNHAAVEAVNHFFGRELDFALDVAIDKALASSGQGGY